MPADLLGRRADIAAARWRVEAASRDVANAKTQFYPNINLVAFAGFSSIGLDRLLDAGSQQWGVGPALRLPIFDAGRLRANLRGKSADLDAAVESYNAAVIDAVRDVADQIASSQAITRQQAEQRAAQTAAEGAYEIAVQRYKAGLGNYLHVLTAETSVLNQRRQAVDLAARALDTQVGLMRALGGGYAPMPPPRRSMLLKTELSARDGAGGLSSSDSAAAAAEHDATPLRTDTTNTTTVIMNTTTADTASAKPPASNPRRKKALTALAAVVVVAGLGWAAYEFLVASHYESTDNAYVQGNVIQITPQIGGTVIAILADDTDFVKAGQPLVQLDPADAKVALDQAEAALAQTVRQVRTLYANNGTLAAQVDAARGRRGRARRATIARANDDLNRRQALIGNGAVSREELNHAQTQLANAKSALAAAQAGVAAAREQLASNQALTDGTSVEQHPSVQVAAAKVREAYLATQRAAHAGAGRRLRRQAHGAARPARGGRHAADVDHPAQPGLGRCQLQGSAAAQHPHRPAGEADRRPVRQEGRIHGHGRRPRRRHRRGLRAAAGAERHRQLDQGGAARAGAHRARRRRSSPRTRCASACRWTPRSTSATRTARPWPMRRAPPPSQTQAQQAPTPAPTPRCAA